MQTVVLEIANAETGDDGGIDGRTNHIYSPSAHVGCLDMVNAQSYKRKAWGIDKDVDGGSHGIVGGSETIAHKKWAESPISPQPRATPWVYSIQLTTRPVRATICGTIELPLAGRWIHKTLSPRALPWAMEILGFQPALYEF